MADANFVGFKATVPVRRRLDVLAAARGGNRSAAIRAAILEHWALRRRFYAALKRAGLRRIRFHDLRHHFGSLAITVLDPYAVQSYMGHQHYSTTQRYLHHKPRREDALRLQAAADAQDVSRDISRTGVHRDQLSATERA